MASRLGRWTLLERLGEGGMAEVFLAQRDGDPEIYVVKKLLSSVVQHPSAGQRLRREAHVAGLLQHPHIVRAVSAGMEDDAFCIAYEYVEGCDLAALIDDARIRGTRLAIDVAVAIGAAVADGLEYAHNFGDDDGKAFGIVHRDVTPRNVMLGYDGTVKLIDFGVAKAGVDEYRTATGMLIGTLHFFSPEQARGERVDSRSDIYSLGAVLFEMLTGRRLVLAEMPIQIMVEIGSGPMVVPSSINPALPPEIDAVLARALAKNPEERFQSMRELRDALLAIAKPASPGMIASLVAAARGDPAKPWAVETRKVEKTLSEERLAPTRIAPPPLKRPPSPNRVALPSAIAAAFALAGLAAWSWFAREASPPVAQPPFATERAQPAVQVRARAAEPEVVKVEKAMEVARELEREAEAESSEVPRPGVAASKRAEKRAASQRAPAAGDPSAAAPRVPAWRASLRALEADPTNQALVDDALTALDAAAANLDPDKRSLVIARLNAAKLARTAESVDRAARALQELDAPAR